MKRTKAPRRPRIALTTRIPVSQAGGIEASVKEIAPRIAARRPTWDVRVVNAFARVAPWNRVPFVGDVLAAVSLALKAGRADVVVVNGGEYAWPRTIRSRGRFRTIVVWHGTRVGEIPALVGRMSPAVRAYYHLEKWLQRPALLARGQIAVSDTTARELQSAYAYRGPLRVVPNGASTYLTPSAKASQTSHRVVWIGTNAFKKGLDIALSACERARASYPDLEFAVVGIPGDGDERPTWITYAGRLDHADSIMQLRAADVLLATSRYEGCSVAVIEALSLGIPIVAGPSVAWMVGEAGYIVDDFAPDSYAAALLKLFGKPSLLTTMAAAGPLRAKRFDWNLAADAYVAEVERCLAVS
jgi:glycosyltransferase involved in cell wall biosynthesis